MDKRRNCNYYELLSKYISAKLNLNRSNIFLISKFVFNPNSLFCRLVYSNSTAYLWITYSPRTAHIQSNEELARMLVKWLVNYYNMKLDVIMEGNQFHVSGFGKNGTRWTTISIITSTNNLESTNHFMLFTQTIFLIIIYFCTIVMHL